ncbi:alpha/beta fold hydrolase [Frankia sp. CNm7]|uniref:Alpha/beta fold hydrolase n=1 Tax=Frankia nepalensis TaxID=1836974 RepID=A0A937RLL0_9ACTN|nr:alpha/beta hydrolase [Frankia nepalensis]MBL7495796.1 alpha/beta fold hydrolase [Frankia nepalensis]MBL7513270.1 alpha/beta fold hydrolase [Frankia nepalensis]MBL7523778.1 alpha/beta fold hydrolase [Frankia nepalensis]MBL7628151.1 alpha/beta fold hydrolase [Frankia nepalensis]
MRLAYKTFGEGPTVLLIHGGAEDAEMLAPQAAALAASGWRAVAYDRRGTGSSTREDWPGKGADQHADDAAELLRELGASHAAPATVLGFSSGGVVALAVAARHPDLVREAIAWEPATLGVLPGGAEIHASINAAGDRHLAEHPEDWVGAFRVTLTVLSEGRADLDGPEVTRMSANAEAVMRDDAQLITRHTFAPGELPAGKVVVAIGAGANALHRQIAECLAEQHGVPLVPVPDADDHEIYLSQPDVLASFLATRLAPR